MIMFDVFNNSNSSIKLLNIELFFYDESHVKPLDYEPTPTYSRSGVFQTPVYDMISPYDYSETFDGETILGPYSKEEFRYYLNPYSQDLKIKVTCDHPIKGLRKSKIIPVHFKKLD